MSLEQSEEVIPAGPAPLLSIVIPTWNRRTLLPDTLDSILAQARPGEVEVVVSDNGSTDGTDVYMKELAASDSRIIYNRNPQNIGLDRNIDTAVSLARGQYVWTFGDDDLLEAGALDHVTGFLRPGHYHTGFVNYSSWDPRMEVCEKPSTLRDQRDIAPATLKQIMISANFFFSFLSTHIVRRDLWMAMDRSRFASGESTDVLYFHVSVHAAATGDNFIAGRPLLRQRQSAYDPAYLYPKHIALNWCRLISSAAPSRDVADAFFSVYVNDAHLTRNALCRMEHAPGPAWYEFVRLVPYFRSFPRFWLTVVPLYFMPSPLIRALRGGWKIIRKYRVGSH